MTVSKSIKKKKKKDWYSKVGLRPHFDLPKSPTRANKIISPENVEKHHFFPFLNFTIKSFKIKKKLKLKEQGDEKGNPYKEREINYSCHSDAYIFSYYNSLLTAEYEKFLDAIKLDNIIAYRSIKKILGKKEIGKSNVDFAAEAFLEIKKRGECYAIGIDIKGFFDNLDHEILYKNISKILGQAKLTKDWYQIYKVLTDFHFVSLDEILSHKLVNLSKDELWDDENNCFHKICSPEILRRIIEETKGEIVKHNKYKKERKGIPQGTNLSGTFANIYMLDFDINLKEYIEKTNGYYRRYSDDILIVVNSQELLEKTIDLIKSELNKIKLELSHDKTICCEFSQHSCLSIGCSLRPNKSEENSFQYLGFTYDGTAIRVRNSTIGRFWIEAIRHTKNIVLGNAFNKKVVPIAKIYGLYSHLSNREADYYGNFYGYIKHAQRVFEEEYDFKKEAKIKKQMANSWQILHKYLNKLKKRYNISDKYLKIPLN